MRQALINHSNYFSGFDGEATLAETETTDEWLSFSETTLNDNQLRPVTGNDDELRPVAADHETENDHVAIVYKIDHDVVNEENNEAFVTGDENYSINEASQNENGSVYAVSREVSPNNVETFINEICGDILGVQNIEDQISFENDDHDDAVNFHQPLEKSVSLETNDGDDKDFREIPSSKSSLVTQRSIHSQAPSFSDLTSESDWTLDDSEKNLSTSAAASLAFPRRNSTARYRYSNAMGRTTADNEDLTSTSGAASITNVPDNSIYATEVIVPEVKKLETVENNDYLIAKLNKEILKPHSIITDDRIETSEIDNLVDTNNFAIQMDNEPKMKNSIDSNSLQNSNLIWRNVNIRLDDHLTSDHDIQNQTFQYNERKTVQFASQEEMLDVDEIYEINDSAMKLLKLSDEETLNAYDDDIINDELNLQGVTINKTKEIVNETIIQDEANSLLYNSYDPKLKDDVSSLLRASIAKLNLSENVEEESLTDSDDSDIAAKINTFATHNQNLLFHDSFLSSNDELDVIEQTIFEQYTDEEAEAQSSSSNKRSSEVQSVTTLKSVKKSTALYKLSDTKTPRDGFESFDSKSNTPEDPDDDNGIKKLHITIGGEEVIDVSTKFNFSNECLGSPEILNVHEEQSSARDDITDVLHNLGDVAVDQVVTGAFIENSLNENDSIDRLQNAENIIVDKVISRDATEHSWKEDYTITRLNNADGIIVDEAVTCDANDVVLISNCEENNTEPGHQQEKGSPKEDDTNDKFKSAEDLNQNLVNSDGTAVDLENTNSNDVNFECRDENEDENISREPNTNDIDLVSRKNELNNFLNSRNGTPIDDSSSTEIIMPGPEFVNREELETL